MTLSRTPLLATLALLLAAPALPAAETPAHPAASFRHPGARDNLKIWAFGQKLKKEVAWDWGAGENVVWEGHDAAVQLKAGTARLTLVADKQPEPAARRNVDLVMLTSDEEQVKQRIDKDK